MVSALHIRWTHVPRPEGASHPPRNDRIKMTLVVGMTFLTFWVEATMRGRKRALVLGRAVETESVDPSDQLMMRIISTTKRTRRKMWRQTRIKMKWTMTQRIKVKMTMKMMTARLVLTDLQMSLENRE
jgi:hypothetical protein